MSTSQSSSQPVVTPVSHSDQSGERVIDPDDVFTELVFYSREICSRCFARIRDHDDYHPDVTVSDYAPADRWRCAGAGIRGETTVSVDTYGYRPLHEARVFCGECGSCSGRADDDTLSKHRAKEVARSLTDRLHEMGLAVDTEVLVYAVGKLKSYRDLASYDTEIFERATKIAITHTEER